MSTPITIQELDSKTMGWIKQKATQRGVTPEALVIELIRKAIQSEQADAPLPVYSDADSLAGTWSEEEAREFIDAVSEMDSMFAMIGAFASERPLIDNIPVSEDPDLYLAAEALGEDAAGKHAWEIAPGRYSRGENGRAIRGQTNGESA